MPMRRPDLSENLLTINQVCETLGISRSKFYDMIKDIPLAPTLESPKRYSRHSVTAWIQRWNKYVPKIVKMQDGQKGGGGD
jgi:predicted DNA-binding transcriptional regulator AlpA